MTRLEEVQKEISDDISIGYTLATATLYTPIDKFHKFAEELLERPILYQQFQDKGLWEEMRKAYEDKRITELKQYKTNH